MLLKLIPSNSKYTKSDQQNSQATNEIFSQAAMKYQRNHPRQPMKYPQAAMKYQKHRPRQPMKYSPRQQLNIKNITLCNQWNGLGKWNEIHVISFA